MLAATLQWQVVENISGFAMREFATKDDLNKRKQVILKTLVCLKIKI